MDALLTAEQMRAIEGAAIASGAVTGIELMERAGRGVVEAVLDWRPDLCKGPRRASVLCGPGNNGGDGFVVARLLNARGWTVDVVLAGDRQRLPPDAATNASRWEGLGPIRAPDSTPLPPPDLVVDALFGTGLARPLDPVLHGQLTASGLAADHLRDRRVAVDIPSGLCSDSGRVLGAGGMDAGLTVTFHAARPGHYLAEGPDRCGRLVVADIGLRAAWPAGCARLALRDAALLAKRGGHKYDHGHALVLSGGVGRGGAARLAARAALRIGAGLVTLGCPPAALIENAARLDAIMLRPIGDDAALIAALEDSRIAALCLGPGLGLGPEPDSGLAGRTRALVAAACRSGRAVVLDADALTGFAGDPAALWSLTHPACVLTPHDGEFARLFPDIAAHLQEPAQRGPAFARLDAVRQAAARAGCTVLLKGRDTVIAGPDGAAVVHAAAYGRAAPWLATAGAGDVLAGLIVGLLARGLAPAQAAETAAWLHVDCALAVGPGLIAEDLPEALPAVLRAMLA